MGDIDSRPQGPASIDNFLARHSGIKATRPSDPDFEAKAETWVHFERVGWPLIAVRPQSEDDVSALIGHLSSNRIPFAARSGGHDLSARSKAAGGVQVDMRDMTHVHVSEDRKTARVGGGILNIDLLRKLEVEGLVTPVATNGIVGYAGWCGLGGYGPWSAVYGLGCDQIVGARVVLWDGRVVDADEKLLRGMRGAAPAFGVIAEFVIKVYPIEETQGGLIIYTGGGLSLEDSIRTWFASFVANPLGPNNLPPPRLQLQPQVFGIGIPGQERSLAIKVTWIGAKSEEWERTLAKLETFAPGATSQMTTMSPVELVRSWDDVIPARVYGGGVKTVSLRLRPCPETIDIMAEHASKKPDEGMWMCHMFHDPVGRDAPTALPSVFKTREPHSMVEIVGFATKPGPMADELLQWAGNFEEAVGASPDALGGRYYSITAEEDVKIDRVFGEEDLRFLLELKREYDPHNFFRAIPLV